MLNKFKKMLLFLILICPTVCFADYGGGWDYHGSGRDHPYSAYIDRQNYIGYADYAPIAPDYLDGPLYVTAPVVTPVPAPIITQAPAAPVTQPAEFVVNIPNVHGGFNSVVIKRSGDGFIGPEGEYYPEFPKVFQLQMRYSN